MTGADTPSQAGQSLRIRRGDPIPGYGQSWHRRTGEAGPGHSSDEPAMIAVEQEPEPAPAPPAQQVAVTVCRSISFRSGHVVGRPHVHDFTLTVALAVSGTGRSVMVAGRLDSFLAQIAARLGHVMLLGPADTETARLPVVWPAGVAGPALPLAHWPDRPDRASLARWIARELAAEIRMWPTTGTSVQISAVELSTPGIGAVVARG